MNKTQKIIFIMTGFLILLIFMFDRLSAASGTLKNKQTTAEETK
jgi:hypothetical protein